mgnify:CR=1 FL=1
MEENQSKSEKIAAFDASGVGVSNNQLFGLPSVSYTHLRAHETVLDLVCRLLLEKKKNKQPNALNALYYTYLLHKTYNNI